jgi:hypothetical protein
MRLFPLLLASLCWVLLAATPALASALRPEVLQEQGTQPESGPEKPTPADSLASPLHQMFEGLLQSLYGTRRAPARLPAEPPCEEELPEERPAGPQQGL